MTDNQARRSAATLLVARLSIANGAGIVRIEGRLDARADAVWAALADPAQRACWLGTFEGDMRLGGDFQARFFASESEGTGQIEVCAPEQHLRVSFTETGTAELHFIDVTLSATGEQTMLVVEERGIPREQLAAYGAGVQIHVEDLITYLRGGERRDAQARWSDLFPSYASMPISPA